MKALTQIGCNRCEKGFVRGRFDGTVSCKVYWMVLIVASNNPPCTWGQPCPTYVFVRWVGVWPSSVPMARSHENVRLRCLSHDSDGSSPGRCVTE